MTDIELVLLSLLIERPMHGYDLEQTIQARGMREWTDIGFSSIYYILNKLVKEGLLSAETQVVEGPGPARKVYHVRQAGYEQWKQASLERLSIPQRQPRGLLLGLANLMALPSHEVLYALHHYRDQLQQQIAYLEQQKQLKANQDFIAALFDFSLAQLRAEYDWIDTFITSKEG